jgi:hypothetical protein
MAISNAVNLANISSRDTLNVDSVTNRVGIASTTPTEALTVVGVVSATSFFGDGSNLEGVSSAGLGTAIADTLPGSVIYYTDNILSISDTFTVDAPSNVAYTQYAEIAVEENKDLIIADGDDFIPDILGLSTEGVTPISGAGGRIRADNFTNKAGNGAPNFPSGLSGTTGTFSGAVSGTTGTFSGSVSVGGTITYEDVTNVDSVGIVTARTGIKVLAGGINAVGLVTGTAFAGYDYLRAPFSTTVNFAVTVAAKTAAHRYNGTGSGNAYLIDGVQSPFLTLTPGRTYRFTLSSSDMSSHPFRFYLEADKATAYTTNVTSTATYTEIVVTDTTPTVLHYQCSAHGYMGNSVNTNSGAVITGETATFYGGLAEKYENAGTTLGSQPNNPLSDGNVILFTGNESGNKTINFTGVHATLSNGETVSFTAILTPNGSGVINVVQVDGQAITVKWSGGSAPSAGSSGQDIYTFQILKTGTGVSNYTVFGAATNYA